MAQKTHFTITAKSIIRPSGSVVQVPAAGLTVGVITNSAVLFPVGASSTDTRIITEEGWQFVAAEDFADLITAISATAITGS